MLYQILYIYITSCAIESLFMGWEGGILSMFTVRANQVFFRLKARAGSEGKGVKMFNLVFCV